MGDAECCLVGEYYIARNKTLLVWAGSMVLVTRLILLLRQSMVWFCGLLSRLLHGEEVANPVCILLRNKSKKLLGLDRHLGRMVRPTATAQWVRFTAKC